MNHEFYKREIERILSHEVTTVSLQHDQIKHTFTEWERALDILSECQGKVVVTGIGKSGHIGRKIAASFASTGTPAFFMHSSEGVHGDLGMIEKNDCVLLLSNSGETQEVLNLLPTLHAIGVQTLSITANPDSTLARSVSVSLNYTYSQEADALALAPSSSAVALLIYGDLLAFTLESLKHFSKNDFHRFHPGGSLGQMLSEGEE